VVAVQSIEALIRANLLVLEAQRRGVPVSDAEAEEWVKRDPVFHPGGVFSPRAFANAKANSPAEFQRVVRRAKMELAARHLQEQLQKQAVGDDATLRAAAERSLSRSPIDVMALPRAEFAGDVPEPREADVIAEYRTHEGRYHRPGRAVLTTVRVPGTPADGAGARARADSALARIRAGATFDEIGAAFGGVRGNQVVLENNFPGSWRGSPRIQQIVFAQRPRAVLPEPVPSTSGWLLVRIRKSMRNRKSAPPTATGNPRKVSNARMAWVC